MLTALVENKLAYATPGREGICRSCGHPMISKCGEIVSWHWAHKAGSDCVFKEIEESEWHLWWKSIVLPEYTEVTYSDKNGERYRADIVGQSGIIECQKSSIDVSTIERRENYYHSQDKEIYWIVNCADAYNNGRISFFPDYYMDSQYRENMIWKHAKKTLAFCRGYLLLDYGSKDLLYTIHKRLDDLSSLSGLMVSRWQFIEEIIGTNRLSDKGLSLYNRRKNVAFREIECRKKILIERTANKGLYQALRICWGHLKLNRNFGHDSLNYQYICSVFKQKGVEPPNISWVKDYFETTILN